MGTNYYLKSKAPCPACGHEIKPMHIGKSSAGWVFSLHAIPEKGINGLADWQREWAAEGMVIEDEYGRRVSPDAMLATITQRQWNGNAARHGWPLAFGIIEGPHGLLREAENESVKHGPGGATYDIITGEFS